MNTSIRLKKLTDLHEKIRMEMLGEDWQYKMELRTLLQKVEDEMRKCHLVEEMV